MQDSNQTAIDTLQLDSIEPVAVVDSKESFLITNSAHSIQQELKENNAPLWEIIVVLIALLLLAILRRTYSKKLSQYANAFVSNRFIGQLTREERSSESMTVILFETLYFVIVAIFSSELYVLINPDFLLHGFNGFALFALLFLALHLLKVFINNLIGWLLGMSAVINDFQFFNFLSHAATAVFLLPVAVLVLFSPLSSYLLIGGGLIIIALLYAYRIIRLTLRFWQEKSFLLKYFILYICGLEILPVLIMAKFAYKTL